MTHPRKSNSLKPGATHPEVRLTFKSTLVSCTACTRAQWLL